MFTTWQREGSRLEPCADCAGMGRSHGLAASAAKALAVLDLRTISGQLVRPNGLAMICDPQPSMALRTYPLDQVLGRGCCCPTTVWLVRTSACASDKPHGATHSQVLKDGCDVKCMARARTRPPTRPLLLRALIWSPLSQRWPAPRRAPTPMWPARASKVSSPNGTRARSAAKRQLARNELLPCGPAQCPRRAPRAATSSAKPLRRGPQSWCWTQGEVRQAMCTANLSALCTAWQPSSLL